MATQAPAAADEPDGGSNVQPLSGPSPFAEGCPGRLQDAGAVAGAEVEPAITIDPGNARHIVATWQQDIGGVASRSDLIASSSGGDGTVYFSGTNQPPMNDALRFSRTTDHGAHWSSAVTIHRPGPTAIDFSGHILVLPDGDLLAVFANAGIDVGQGALLASRSLDEGRTWEPPVEIASRPVGTFTDPETGVELPQPGFPSSVVAPDGTVYVASEASTSPSAGAVSASRSDDGGRTWSSKQDAGGRPVRLRTRDHGRCSRHPLDPLVRPAQRPSRRRGAHHRRLVGTLR